MTGGLSQTKISRGAPAEQKVLTEPLYAQSSCTPRTHSSKIKLSASVAPSVVYALPIARQTSGSVDIPEQRQDQAASREDGLEQTRHELLP
jgi:hypothetical protein